MSLFTGRDRGRPREVIGTMGQSENLRVSLSKHRSERDSVYCRYCGAHPLWWSQTRCSRPEDE
jgi:hypothetical protein